MIRALIGPAVEGPWHVWVNDQQFQNNLMVRLPDIKNGKSPLSNIIGGYGFFMDS